MVLRNRDVGYSCLTDSSHINNQVLLHCNLLCPTAGRLLSFMPTAGPHQRLLLMLSSLLPCWLSSAPLCLHAGCLMCNMVAAMNHHGTTMGSHRAGVACILILLVRLAKHSAFLFSVAPVPTALGVKSLTMGLGGWWWL